MTQVSEQNQPFSTLENKRLKEFEAENLPIDKQRQILDKLKQIEMEQFFLRRAYVQGTQTTPYHTLKAIENKIHQLYAEIGQIKKY